MEIVTMEHRKIIFVAIQAMLSKNTDPFYDFEFKCGNSKILRHYKCQCALDTLRKIIHHSLKWWIDMCRVCHTLVVLFKWVQIVYRSYARRLIGWNFISSDRHRAIALTKYFVFNWIEFTEKNKSFNKSNRMSISSLNRECRRLYAKSIAVVQFLIFS